MLFHKRKVSLIVYVRVKLWQIYFSKEFSGVDFGNRSSEQEFEKTQM